MRNEQTIGSLGMTALLAAGFGLVAFGVALAVGGWDYSPAAGVGIGVAAAAGVFLLIGFHEPNRTASRLGAAPEHEAPVHEAPAAAAPAAAQPLMSAPAAVATPPAGAARRPAALAAARSGKADDLKLIVGIGPKLEKLCHELGFYHFDQIANWTAEEIAWVDENLEGFKGRVTRDDWVGQARKLAAGSRPH
jgi:predicted flap endonuclease-1-like 5' DNA nuclease